MHRRMRPHRLAAATVVATAAPLLVLAGTPGGVATAAPATSAASATRDDAPTAHIWAPSTATGDLYGKRQLASVDIPLRVVAGDVPIEVWSTRASYADPIHSVVRTPTGDVALPDGSMTTFNALDDVVSIVARDARTGEVVRRTSRDLCLNSWTGQRVRPDAPARSPYPTSCYSNPYSVGSVQGIPAGWSMQVLDYGSAIRLPKGRYRVSITVRPTYAAALGMSPADATRTLRVKVSKQHDDHDHGVAVPSEPPHAHRATTSATGPTGPTGARVARDEVDGPVPNLRSLPAWGIDVSDNGNFLRFSATVWNAGTSPLVVDGFVAEEQDRMDAYQYFFDADGNQTGYSPVGSFEFDHKKTHHHWHFRDFATYTLLNADRTTAVKSRKEAFCLANTDAVDLTVPAAEWRPENTDLGTDCGSEDSLSLRQVLAAGWGDTYAQFRAGQSFDLRGLPNGTYYIATIANPRQRLVESSTDDNVALRKVVIGGREGRRTVRVPQVGVVVEPVQQDGPDFLD